MMTKQESGQPKYEPLRVLVLAAEEQQHSDVHKFLQAHRELAAAEITRVHSFEEAQARLEQKSYDLVLGCPGPPCSQQPG
jgi:hypothetical protein